jgi:hypothetical protein
MLGDMANALHDPKFVDAVSPAMARTLRKSADDLKFSLSQSGIMLNADVVVGMLAGATLQAHMESASDSLPGILKALVVPARTPVSASPTVLLVLAHLAEDVLTTPVGSS